jgi:hypothetical protein
MRNKGGREGDEYSVKFMNRCDRLAKADWINNVLLTSELPLQRTNQWCC